MENFSRNSRFSGRGNSGGFAGRNSGKTKMYKAVCSKCGQDCEVPFSPSKDKPVFCSDCFRKERNGEQKKISGRDSRKSGFSDKKMYETICDKCGKKCEVPFRPTGNKPVYCSECFGKVDNDKSFGQSNKQLETIESKLDKILELLTPVILKKPKEKEETVKKEKVVKPEKINKPKKKVAISKTKTKKKK